MDVVSHLVKYNAQTAGRDKLCRVLQYSSKFLAHYLHTHGKDPNLIKKFNLLENNLSATRKLLRFGKSLDMVQGALKSMELTDTVLQLTLTLSKLNQAAFIFVDHFIWIGKTGLMDLDTKHWSKVSSRFWLVAIMTSMTRNLYDIINIIAADEEKSQENKDTQLISAAKPKRNSSIVKLADPKHLPVIVDTIKNSADILLPLSSLGYVDISPGTQGILGIISSIMGMLTVWNSDLKLVPS